MASITKHFNTDHSTIVAQRRRKIERLFCVKVFVQAVPDRNLLHEINISGARLDMRIASMYIDALVDKGEIERTTLHLETLFNEPLIEGVEKQSCAVIKKIGPDKYEIRGLKNQVALAVDLLEEISIERVTSRKTSQASKRLSTNIQDSITKSNRKMSNCFNASEKVKRAVLGCLNSVDDIDMGDKEIKIPDDKKPNEISDSDDDADDVFSPSENKKDLVGDESDASVIIIDSPIKSAHHSISKTSQNLQEDADASVLKLTSQFQQLQTPSKPMQSNTGSGNQQLLNKVVIKNIISDQNTLLPAYQEPMMTKTTNMGSVQNDRANENVVKPMWKEKPFSRETKPASAHPLVEKKRVVCMVEPLQQQSISDNRSSGSVQIHPTGPCNPGETTSVSSASSKLACKDKTCTADRAFGKAKKKLNKTSPKIKEINDILTMNVRKEDPLGNSQGEKVEKAAKRKIKLSPQKDVNTVDDRTFVKAKRKLNKTSPKLKEINDLMTMNVRNDGSEETKQAKKAERNIKRKAEMSPRADNQRACAFVDKLEDKNELESESIKRRKMAIDKLHYGSEWGTKQDYKINKRHDKPPRMRDRDRKRDRKLVKDDYNIKRRSEQLRYVVIDGSNVAMAHGKNRVFSCRGIRICVDFFLRRGHNLITVFLPLWRKCRPRIPDSVTDRYILDDLEDEGILVYTPSRRIGNKLVAAYDDRFILELADREDGIVVSNDQYRDLMYEKASWRTLITERLLMYTFVRDNFMVPNDPLGRLGPTLDCFLRKTPFQEDAYKFFRDEFKYLNSLYPECLLDRKPTYREMIATHDRW